MVLPKFKNPIEEIKAQKELDSLASWIKDNYDKAKAARQPFERQWQLNYAFYKGRQNVAFLKGISGTINSGLVVPKAPPHRVRHITNRIKPIIRTELARLISNKPNASVVPASSEDEDLFAAQAGEQLWESIYSSKKLHRIYSRAAFWVCITGNGFVKDWWDPSIVTPEYQGDLAYGAVTPFHLIVPDLMEEDIEDQPWVINVYTKPVEWANNFFKEKFTPDVVASTEIMGNSFFRAQNQNSRPDSVLVMEIWFKPGFHRLFPSGGMATCVNGKIKTFFNQGYPFAHGDYPFTKFSHIPTGEFYSDSVINDLIDPQKEYNRTRGQIIEAKNRMAKPQLVAPQGSVNPASITTQPGQVIFYKHGMAPPQPLPLQPLPSYVLQELDRTVNDMEDISSQHEISRGQAPNGVTAATAISYLQEKDDSPLTATYQSIEQGWEKLAKHTLSNVNQFWETPRIVSGTGIDGFYDEITLKGSEIATGMDIRIEAGSALPTSKAAKQAFIMDCMKMGFIDPNKGLSMMDMGGLDKLYDELKADERQAKRENLKIRNIDVQAIIEHMQIIANSKYQAEQFMAQQQQQTALPALQDQMQQTQTPDTPPEFADAQRTIQTEQGMGQPVELPMVTGDAGYGQDTQTQAPLIPSDSIVPVNTWDNHQVHIEVHNTFRKSQAFELLPEPIKQQFEAHVLMHATALNQAAMNAQAQMPAPDMQNPFAGAHNGSGAPVGTNQFSGGPPNG